MPKSMHDMLACWKGRVGHQGNGGIWQEPPLCLM